MSFTIEEVYSEEQLAIALGANMESGMVSVAGSFDFNDTTKRSRLVAKFIQKYYSIDLDIPARPTDFFKDLNTITQLGAVSPMYVSTVTYGRLALFTVESSYSATEIKAALDAAYNGAISASASIDTAYSTMMTNSSIKAYIVGGSGADAAGSVNGYDAFKDYITRGGDYSSTSPGAPISYKLRYLSNNEIGKIVLSSEYDVRNCQPVATQTKKVNITLQNMVSTNDCDWADNTIDLYGTVTWVDPGPVPFGTFWSRASSSHSNTTTYPGNDTPITKTFTAPFDSAQIGLSANISDWDASSANDVLGGFPQDPTWLEVGTLTSRTMVLEILGGGCHIDCTFIITVQ
jgi:thiol-activated cytolysin